MEWYVAEVARIPRCDVCQMCSAAYDAQTKEGPWAYMCEECFRVDGAGRLGLGWGQRLVLADDQMGERG